MLYVFIVHSYISIYASRSIHEAKALHMPRPAEVIGAYILNYSRKWAGPLLCGVV